MTTQQLIDYYASLLILQYVGKPKAYATVQTMVSGVIMDQLPTQVQNGFDIETAVGKQLDILGKYVGVVRSGTGFKGQPITLGDSDFRSLIKMAIVRNNSSSSLASIQNLLFLFFFREVFVYDHANMQMSYLISSSVGSQDLAQLFVEQNLLPKPMGVQLSATIYLDTLSVFGLLDARSVPPAWNSSTIYNAGNQVFTNGIIYGSNVDGNINQVVTNTAFWTPVIFPLNDVRNYHQDWHWLSAADAIII